MAVAKQFFTINGNTDVKLRLTANYSPIATELGLTAAAATDPGQPISTTEALTRRLGSRIRITYATSASTAKRKSALVFCAADQEDVALKNLTGKNFGSDIIVSCGYPKRAIYR